MPTRIIELQRAVLIGIALAFLATVSFQIESPVQASAQAQAGASRPAPAAAPATNDLPELVYICPMPQDAEVVLDKAGKCPKCGMDLKPVRIVAAYSCLNNTAFIDEKPGICPTDRTQKVQISASLFFGCRGNNDIHEMNPGKCADGSDRIRKYEARPHGDHNPKHGGQLFMADDAWHHVEGAYPSAGLFRVYFYDDWTKPMAPKGVTARAVIKDKAGKELGTFPLKTSSIMNAMEVQVPSAATPFIASLFVAFKPGDRERKFDFQFNEYSKEPAVAAPAKSGAKVTPPTFIPVSRASAVVSRVSFAAYEPAPVVVQDPPQNPGVQLETQLELMPPITLIEDPIPTTARDVLKELMLKTGEVEQLIKDGALPMVWVPAMRSKNLALALLDDHIKEIPEKQRPLATSAVNRLLRAAWQIDMLGDLGDKDKILTVHAAYTQAAADLTSAYASLR